MSKPITFIATAPPTATFVRVHGDGGLRLTLDISDTEADGLIDDLYRMRGQQLSVAIVAAPKEDTTETHGSAFYRD